MPILTLIVALWGCGPRAGCEVAPERVRCASERVPLRIGALRRRDLHVALPTRPAPSAGYPTVLLFQGSLFPPEYAFDGKDHQPFGALHQAELVARLLDDGYAVIAPETRFGGRSWWDTNVVGYADRWERAPDHDLMLALFAAIDDGTLGDLDAGALYATGISSGGYMTSRMAVSYPGRFRALAIHAGSYATCAGPLCDVPALPEDHPPTLFLHGERDDVVPIGTMVPYADALADAGIAAPVVTDPEVGHAFLPVAADEVAAFFADPR